MSVWFFLDQKDIKAQVFYRDSINAYSQIEKIVKKMNLKNIIVHVDYIKSDQLLKGREVFGYAYKNKDEYYICIKSDLKYNEIKTIITHEMIHVWQMHTGKLKTYKNGWVWNNKFYPLSTSYKKRTHEIDAKILESNRFFQ